MPAGELTVFFGERLPPFRRRRTQLPWYVVSATLRPGGGLATVGAFTPRSLAPALPYFRGVPCPCQWPHRARNRVNRTRGHGPSRLGPAGACYGVLPRAGWPRRRHGLGAGTQVCNRRPRMSSHRGGRLPADHLEPPQAHWTIHSTHQYPELLLGTPSRLRACKSVVVPEEQAVVAVLRSDKL
jgi:hypothetical protein